MVRDAAWFVLWAAAATLLIIAVWALVARRENRRDDALDGEDRETVALFTAMNNKDVPRPGADSKAPEGAEEPNAHGPGHHERPRAAHAHTLRGWRPWRRDGMGAQGEPATGRYPPRANTIPPRTCGAASPGGARACSLRPGHAGTVHQDRASRAGVITWRIDPDRCSDPPEVSCSDAGCPVHGEVDEDALTALVGTYWTRLEEQSPQPSAPGTDLVLASQPLAWGDDDTLTTMLAVRARHKKIEWNEAARRTDAILARADPLLGYTAPLTPPDRRVDVAAILARAERVLAVMS